MTVSEPPAAQSKTNRNDDAVIRIKGLRTQFGSQVNHDNLDLDVTKGEVLGVLVLNFQHLLDEIRQHLCLGLCIL